MEGADAVNPGAWVRHTASMRGRMTDDERRGLDRLLTHHAKRLALLIELLGGSDRVVGVSAGSQYLAFELYRKTRNELRREYDALEHRTWSKAEAIVATALYAAVWDSSTEHPINTTVVARGSTPPEYRPGGPTDPDRPSVKIAAHLRRSCRRAWHRSRLARRRRSRP